MQKDDGNNENTTGGAKIEDFTGTGQWAILHWKQSGTFSAAFGALLLIVSIFTFYDDSQHVDAFDFSILWGLGGVFMTLGARVLLGGPTAVMEMAARKDGSVSGKVTMQFMAALAIAALLGFGVFCLLGYFEHKS